MQKFYKKLAVFGNQDPTGLFKYLGVGDRFD